jgi:hypothetical protein
MYKNQIRTWEQRTINNTNVQNVWHRQECSAYATKLNANRRQYAMRMMEVYHWLSLAGVVGSWTAQVQVGLREYWFRVRKSIQQRAKSTAVLSANFRQTNACHSYFHYSWRPVFSLTRAQLQMWTAQRLIQTRPMSNSIHCVACWVLIVVWYRPVSDLTRAI